jgi:ABC-type transport system substrate-binding protein
VVLTSSTPNTAIPAIVTNPALGIVDAAKVQATGGTDASNAATADKAESSLNSTSEGSGPCTLSSFSLTSQVVLKANPHYWGSKPKYPEIVIRNVQASVQNRGAGRAIRRPGVPRTGAGRLARRCRGGASAAAGGAARRGGHRPRAAER